MACISYYRFSVNLNRGFDMSCSRKARGLAAISVVALAAGLLII